jgi:hypothetical protein
LLRLAAGDGCMLHDRGGRVIVRRVAMSDSDQFRRYAEEAMLWVAQSKTEEEKQILVELLCTWTAAAVASDRIGVLSGSTPEPRAP